MTTYAVHANPCDFGLIVANSEQDPHDLAAQMAGNKSEAEMVERLGQPSDIVAEEA